MFPIKKPIFVKLRLNVKNLCHPYHGAIIDLLEYKAIMRYEYKRRHNCH